MDADIFCILLGAFTQTHIPRKIIAVPNIQNGHPIYRKTPFNKATYPKHVSAKREKHLP